MLDPVRVTQYKKDWSPAEAVETGSWSTGQTEGIRFVHLEQRRRVWSLTCRPREGYREDEGEVFSEVHRDGARGKEIKL